MIYLFFFVSGFTALVYQVVWTRSAGLALGNTPGALGMVVALFMAGLALGSAWAARAAASVRPLRLYGIIEIAIGLYAPAAPWLIRRVSPLLSPAYGSPFFEVAGLAAAAVLLLPATFLMGATLPLLAQHMDSKEAPGRLYAVNTAGAALGTLSAGLLLLPRIGMAATTAAAAAANVMIGLAAARMGGGVPGPSPRPVPPAPLTRAQKAAVGIYAASGFAALVLEMAWTRALVLSLGSTVYAFSLILFWFILGLALGAAMAARRASRLRNPLAAAALIQLAIAGWGIFLTWALSDLPVRIHDVIMVVGESFLLLQLAEAGVVMGLVLPPTILMGALMPVALAPFKTEGGTAGRSVGCVYAWNTAAAIAGSLAATFLLIPRLGIDLTLRLAACVNLGGSLAALWLGPPHGRGFRTGLTGAVAGAAAAAFIVPRWNLTAASIGSYFYADFLERFAAARNKTIGDVVHQRDIEAAYWDAFGLTTVHRSGKAIFLRVNGKTDASWGTEDMAAQVLISQVPMILHPAPRDVLVIGLGSGITLANAQSHGPPLIECVEISPAVVRAAAHFDGVNGGALKRPGTRIVVGDGRAHVRHCGRTYDVIASEPSNLWIRGTASLFTTEFFREARARLNPGGIFAQWVHAYRLAPCDFRGAVRTFTEAFPRAMLWEMKPGGDYLLLGLTDERKWRLEEIERRIRPQSVAEKLSQVQIPDAANFLAGYVMGPTDLASLGAEARPMTDDDCWIEYTAPLSMLRSSISSMVDLLDGRRRSAGEIMERAGLDASFLRKLDLLADARRRLCRALYPDGGKEPAAFRTAVDSIIEDCPCDAMAAHHAESAGRTAFRRAGTLQSSGRNLEALDELEGVPTRSSWHAKACVLRGWIMVCLGRPEDARERYMEALAARPRMAEAQIGLAQVEEAQGRLEEARKLLEEAVRWDPRSAPARVAHARFLLRRSENERARAEVEQALRDNPADQQALELKKRHWPD